MKKKIFFLIILLAIVLRLFHLGKTPAGLEWDEVALGYDAYSILKTGKDQFGEFLPLSFRSIDDYKPPLYIYSTVLSIVIFGLNEFSARLPSAVFGIFAVVLTYYLVLELFQDNKKKYYLALFSSLFLAISPWHLQFSRAAFETNLSVTVTIAAVYFFLKGIRKSPKLFLLSAVFFGLALFSYHSTRVVTPLLLLFLFFVFRRRMPAKKFLLFFLLIYGIFIYFFIPILRSPQSQIRFRVTNVLDVDKNRQRSANLILEDKKVGAEFSGRIFHNRRLSLINFENIQEITRNYLIHFSPEFLFVRGDVPLHHAPDFGVMYYFDAILLVSGIVFYLLKYKARKNIVLLVWMLLSPVPACVTYQVPHAVRTEIILPTLQIFCAIGLVEILLLLRKELGRKNLLSWLFNTSVAVLFVYGVGMYLHQYYIHTNLELSEKWLYGRKQAVEYSEKVKDKYDKIIVSASIDMPLNFWLFYSKYSPRKYLKEGGTVSGGFAERKNKFGKYEFRDITEKDFKTNTPTLLIGTPQDFDSNMKSLKDIYYLNNKKAIQIVEVGV